MSFAYAQQSLAKRFTDRNHQAPFVVVELVH